MTAIESAESTATVIAVFGSGTLVKSANGRMEFRGGTAAEFIEVKEWASMFMPEAIIRKG
jgi:hypothetical protein